MSLPPSNISSDDTSTSSKRKNEDFEPDHAIKRRKINDGTPVVVKMEVKTEDGDTALIKALKDNISTKDDFIEDLIKNTKDIEQKYSALNDELKDLHKELAKVRSERNESYAKHHLLFKGVIEYGVMHHAVDLLKKVNLPGGCNKSVHEYNDIVASINEIRKSTHAPSENSQHVKSVVDLYKKSRASVSEELNIESAILSDNDKITKITMEHGEIYERLRTKLLVKLVEVAKYSYTQSHLDSVIINQQSSNAFNKIKLMSRLGYKPASEELKKLEKLQQENRVVIVLKSPPKTHVYTKKK
jgi:uncharacterized protein YoxC